MHRISALALTFAVGVSARGQSADQPVPLATIPLRLAGTSTPILSVRVNGSTPLTFILDSGAGSCLLDTRRASRLHLKVGARRQGTGAGKGTFRLDSITTPLTFRVGKLSFQCSRAYTVDLSGQPAILGRRIDGILGFDFFRQYVVALDYSSAKIGIFDPATFRYTGRGDTLPIQMARHVPHVEATLTAHGVPPARRSLLVDTGSEDAVDDSLILASPSSTRRVIAGVGLGQRYEAVSGTLTEVRIGTAVLHDVPSVAPGVPLIGTAVLRRFRMFFDYSRERLYLEQQRE
jgi:hypothetical protein